MKIRKRWGEEDEDRTNDEKASLCIRVVHCPSPRRRERGTSKVKRNDLPSARLRYARLGEGLIGTLEIGHVFDEQGDGDQVD